MTIAITGIDPGLVHTGIVTLQIVPRTRTAWTTYHVVESSKLLDGKVDTRDTAHRVGEFMATQSPTHVFIEEYRPRALLDTNTEMLELVRDIHSAIPKSVVVNNTGSKKVVKRALLELLHLKTFPTTHHQDLQAAARILVYGALKDPELNYLLYTIVEAHLDHNLWEIT